MVDVEKILAEASAELAGVREALKSQGLDPDQLGLPRAIEISKVDASDSPGVAGAQQPPEALRADAQRDVAAALASARAAASEHGLTIDLDDGDPPAEPAAFRASDVLAELERAAACCRDAGVPDANNLALAKLHDVAFVDSLTGAETRLAKATKVAPKPSLPSIARGDVVA